MFEILKRLDRMSIPVVICTKCSKDVSKVYDCKHTQDEDYCVECYTELHYYITEKKSE